MSYPIHQVPGGSAARTVHTESGFWGLDLSGGAMGRSFSRAVASENLIWEGESLKRRPGYQKIAGFSMPIHGIYPYGDTLIVHAGAYLYRLVEGEEPVKLDLIIGNTPSQGVIRSQALVVRRCLEPDTCYWTRETLSGEFLFVKAENAFVFYDGETVRPVADGHWGIGAKSLFENGIDPVYYAAVPFTAVAKNPLTNVGDVDPKGSNRLSQFRCESFYVPADATVAAFRLTCLYNGFRETTPPEVQLRDSDGNWHCFRSSEIKVPLIRVTNMVRVNTPIIRGGMSFTCDENDCAVTLDEGDYTLADDGMDNVRITYAVRKESPKALISARAMGLYGADGADDVLFLGGSPYAPGEDGFSAPGDFFCFYETSVERLGSDQTPVTGYCRLSDGRLAVLKNDPNSTAVFFREHKLVEVGATMSGEAYLVDAYPSKSGAAVEGCVSPFSVGIAGNEPIFLAQSGLYSVRSVSNELTNLNETVRRSIPIDPLLSSYDAALSRSVRWKNCYLITFGKDAFITDGQRDSDGALRFLKWTLGHGVTALGKKDEGLYFGDSEGNIYLFGEGTDDAGIPFTAYWETPEAEAANGRRLILRRLWAAVTPGGHLTAQLRSDRTPLPAREVDLTLLDLGNIDFADLSFDGSKTVRWVPLAGSGAAESISLRLELEGEELRLWGLRMTYEKGGLM